MSGWLDIKRGTFTSGQQGSRRQARHGLGGHHAAGWGVRPAARAEGSLLPRIYSRRRQIGRASFLPSRGSLPGLITLSRVLSRPPLPMSSVILSSRVVLYLSLSLFVAHSHFHVSSFVVVVARRAYRTTHSSRPSCTMISTAPPTPAVSEQSNTQHAEQED